MNRRALLIGIDSYENFSDLPGCSDDVLAMRELLEKNVDGSANYTCNVLADDGEPITRARLRRACRELFSDYQGDVLLYFSGHGTLTEEGGYIATTDAEEDDYGVSMQEILQMAFQSQARDILIILDCCNSGDMGNPTILNVNADHFSISSLRDNMTVMAASRNTQTAGMSGGRSLFTSAVIDALEGGAADHMGWVTAPAIYAYVEKRFGEFDQRPVYKSNTNMVNVIRQCAPLIDRLKLNQLTDLFLDENFQFPLDPEFEPEDEHGNVHEPVNQEKVDLANLFKEYRDAGLLKPSTPGEQLFWTARKSHAVELTIRGKEYWRLVKYGRI